MQTTNLSLSPWPRYQLHSLVDSRNTLPISLNLPPRFNTSRVWTTTLQMHCPEPPLLLCRRVWIMMSWLLARRMTQRLDLIAQPSQGSSLKTFHLGPRVAHFSVMFLLATPDTLFLLDGNVDFLIISMASPIPLCVPQESSWRQNSSGTVYRSSWVSGLKPASLAKFPRSSSTSKHHLRLSVSLSVILNTSMSMW